MTQQEILSAMIAALDAQRAVLVEALHRQASLIGERFGELTVVERAPDRLRKNGKPRAYWRCRCSCGAIVEVRRDHLSRVKSCGHLSRAAQFKAQGGELELGVPSGAPRAAVRRLANHQAALGAMAKTRADAFAESLRPMLSQAVADNCTLQQIAERLTEAGIQARFGGRWNPCSVRRLLLRLGLKTRRAHAQPRVAAARVETTVAAGISDLLGDVGGLES